MLGEVIPVCRNEYLDRRLYWVRIVGVRTDDYVSSEKIGNTNIDANAFLIYESIHYLFRAGF